MRVGILGGGVAGLACGHYLAKLGHVPVVIESAAELGRMGAPIVHAGAEIDRIPTVLRRTDSALCGLLAELGMLGRATWRPTSSTVLLAAVAQPVTAARQLGSGASSALQRLRARLGFAQAARVHTRALDLDSLPAAVWLPRAFGRSLYERCWQPFMAARFGIYADEVSAYWCWRELYGQLTVRRHTSGHLRGGVGGLSDRLRRSIERRGGEVRLCAGVTGVEADIAKCKVELDGREEEFDAVISTLDLEELAKLARARLRSELPRLDQPFLGGVTVLVILRRSLGPPRDGTVLEQSAPFHRVIRVTHAARAGSEGNLHLVYLHRDCVAHSESYRQADELVVGLALECLSEAFPAFEARQVEAVHVSRNPVAEPIATVGQLQRRPPTRVGASRFYLCTAVQAHPRRVGWDADVTLARETAAMVDAAALDRRSVGDGRSARGAEAYA